MKKMIIIFLAMILSQAGQASVWEDTEVWNQEWEMKYSEWFEQNVNEKFFTQGKYGGIKTDCADAAYYARAIFAMENKLPFEYSIYGSGKLITNRTTAHDDLQDARSRLLRFFERMADYVSTQSVHQDTYPVALRREYIRPGIVVNHRSTGIFGTVTHHLDLVKTVKNNGNIVYISSTLPADIRELTQTYSLRSQPDDEKTQRQGFRAWIWPQNRGKKLSENLGFSTEQYTITPNSSFGRNEGVRSLSEFESLLKDRLRLKHNTREELEQQSLDEVCTQFIARVKIIKQAEDYRQTLNGRCMNAKEYDDYSTPTRDSRVRSVTEQYIINFIGRDYDRSGQSEVDKKKDFLNSVCPVQELYAGRTMTFHEFLKMMSINSTSISSNPNVSIAARWGQAYETSNCPEY